MIGRARGSVFSVWNYLIFFLTVSSLVTCSFYVFIRTMDIDFAALDIARSAGLTFANVLVLSLICTVIDGVRRRYTVERPVKRILGATRQLTQGDFTARIAPLHGIDGMNGFDAIIADFNKMAEELGGIETLRTDFMANVSHELRTPLTVIQNYSSMLQDPDLPDGRRVEYAKAIDGAAVRLAGLIANILKLSKLESQRIYPKASEYDLGEQLRECLLGFEDAWEAKGLEIEADIDDLSVKADGELLSVVWNNLISNAVKFTGPGGKVRVSLRREGAMAVVAVADTGCGIPAEYGRRIFEKFFQCDESHSAQGNGL
ncbi:MAG: HAMP domain-containing histidine kinase, partial [Oscillospiraceae bacterium]|nr:HAMP domain-containing histidine kinase [Oscillospiraceae bacterium]